MLRQTRNVGDASKRQSCQVSGTENDKHNPEYQKLFLRYVPFEHLTTRDKNIRMRKSRFKRKLISRNNRKSITNNNTRTRSLSHLSLTYNAHGEALSKLKTKTIATSKTMTKTRKKNTQS